MAASHPPAAVINRRWGHPWLVGLDNAQFWQTMEARIEALQQLKRTVAEPIVLLAEPDPLNFLASFFTACLEPCYVLLGNPQWGIQEWQQVAEIATPDTILGPALPWPQPSQRSSRQLSDWAARQAVVSHPLQQTVIGIPTGGTSGQVRFALHTWDTLLASVQGFQQAFQTPSVQAYCVLPLHHVSGLMQAMRVFTSGGQLAIQPFKALLAGNCLDLPPQQTFISLVPTQLQRLLASERVDADWLRQHRAILLGGAPAWPTLLDQAQQLSLPITLTYGMTETASQIATLQPQDFLGGNRSSGSILPHAAITLVDDQGQPVPRGQPGQLQIQAKSLALGYLTPTGVVPLWARQPQTGSLPGAFTPDDVGYLDAEGYLHILGRNSSKILTGGENVFPEEIEGLLHDHPWVEDVCVVGVPDAVWGQAVAAVVVPANPSQKPAAVGMVLSDYLKGRIATYKHPKQWQVTETLPRNPQGKINRQRVMEWLVSLLPVDGTNISC